MGVQVGCLTSGPNPELASETEFLEYEEVNGIPGVAVECVDIGRNTSCEGDSLVQY